MKERGRAAPADGDRVTLHVPSSPEPFQADSASPAARPLQLTRFEVGLLCFLMLSFAYEVPLVYITSRYRLNPRLFDIATISLIGYWVLFGQPRGWRLRLDHYMVKPWLALIGWFSFVCFTTAMFVPMNIFVISGWYAFRYVVASLVLVIALSAPLSETQKRRMLWAGLIGGTWVSFYGMLQFTHVVSNVRYLPTGYEISDIGADVVNSTLGPSYFHAGQFGILSGLIGLTLFRCSKGSARTLAAVLGPFSMIPAVVAGSRAGFIGLIIAVGALGAQREYRKYLMTFVMGAVVAGVISLTYVGSLTKARNEEGASSTPESRFMQGPITLKLVQDTVGPRMWLLGGGFYVTPIGSKHRIGYGVHNIFLFPLEQSGVIGFGISIWLWYRLWMGLRPSARRGANTTDAYFSAGMYAYLVALFVVGWGGQIFWLGFGNENLGVYQFLLFGLAMKTTTPDDAPAHAAAIANREIVSPFLAAGDAGEAQPTS